MRARGSFVSTVGLLAAAGCGDLLLKNLNECGNGVVETPLEDCDRITTLAGTECGLPNDPIRACHYICTPGADTPKCPPGWSCESDGVCRQKKGICGNAILDPGEECEPLLALPATDTACGAATDPLRACRYVCGGATSAKCPSGWACGTDTICHLPAGAYEERTPPHDFAENDIRVGDFDGNGYGDIVGVDASNLRILYGASNGPFSRLFELKVAFVTGPPGVGDLDNDGLSDVVIPERVGLFVLRGQRDQTLAPMAYSSVAVPSSSDLKVIPLRVAPDDPDHHMIILTKGAGADRNRFLLFAVPADRSYPASCSDRRATCIPADGRSISDLAGRIPIGNIHRAEDRTQIGFADELVLALRGDDYVLVFTPSRACSMIDCVIKPIQLGGPIRLPGRVAVPTGDPMTHRAAQIVDVDADGNPDIVVSVINDRMELGTAIAYGDGHGQFFDANHVEGRASLHTFSVIYTRPGGARQKIGKMLFPLAAGDLDGDRWADYAGVTSVTVPGPPMIPEPVASGVFLTVERSAATSTLALSVLLPPPLSWDEAMILDFNRDGINDLAAIQSTEDGVDFLIGAGGGFFNSGRVSTTYHPSSLRSGDFDGDRFTDVAVIEEGCASSSTATSLSVLFGGSPTLPTRPVSMGCLKYIQQIEPSYIVSGLVLGDRISDLLAVSNQKADASGQASIAILRGTTERRMVAPFVLTTTRSARRNQPLGVEVGRFDVSGDAFPDMIATTQEISDQIGAAGRPSLWTVKGAGHAEFDPQSNRAHLFASLPQCVDAGFDIRCFLWTAAPIGAGEGAAIVGADNSDFCTGRRPPTPRLLVLRQMTVEPGNVQVTCERHALPRDHGPIRQIQLSDLDGDGRPDLLLTFTSAVSVYWNTGAPFAIGGAQAVTTSVPLPARPGSPALTPFSVAILHAPSPARTGDLAIATIGGLYLSQLQANRTFVTRRTASTPPLDFPLTARPSPGDPFHALQPWRLIAADMNRDGLDDLVLLADQKVHVYFATELRGQATR